MKLGRELPCLAALAALYVWLALAAPAFFAGSNLRDLALSNVATLLVAAGMTLVIVCGEIDISAGSAFAVISVFTGFLAKSGLPPIGLLLAAGLLGGLAGSLNGIIVARLRAPSIVVTLATMVALREALRWFTGGAWVEDLPPNFQWFGLSQASGEIVLIFGAAVLFTLLAAAARQLSILRAIYAVGSDREAARLAGIRVEEIKLLVFVLMGILTGLAAFLNAARFSDVPANSGLNLELLAIAAVVVGGTPITGGRGTLWGTLAGVALLGSIGPALTFLGIGAYWAKAIAGAVILLTVLFDALGSARESAQGDGCPLCA